MIKIIWPCFVETARNQLALPKVSRLRGRVRPGKTMRGGFRNYSFNRLVCLSFAEHGRIAANPFGVRMILKVLRDGRKRARQIKIVAVDKAKDFPGRSFDAF